jgi:hypothetical protein
MSIKIVEQATYHPGSRVDESKSPPERLVRVVAKVMEILISETASLDETYTALRAAGRGTRELCAAFLARRFDTSDHEDPRIVEALEGAVRSSKEALDNQEGPIVLVWDADASPGWTGGGSSEQN